MQYRLESRSRTEKRKADYIPIFAGGEEYSQEIICPIISGGDVMGTVVFTQKKNTKNSVKWKKNGSCGSRISGQTDGTVKNTLKSDQDVL